MPPPLIQFYMRDHCSSWWDRGSSHCLLCGPDQFRLGHVGAPSPVSARRDLVKLAFREDYYEGLSEPLRLVLLSLLLSESLRHLFSCPNKTETSCPMTTTSSGWIQQSAMVCLLLTLEVIDLSDGVIGDLIPSPAHPRCSVAY